MKKSNVLQPPQEGRKKAVIQRVRIVRGLSATLFVLSICFATGVALAQQFGHERGQGGFGGQGGGGVQENNLASLDPGPRVGFITTGDSAYPNNPGNPIKGLSTQQLAFFANGLSQFNELEGVIRNGPGDGGLGPTLIATHAALAARARTLLSDSVSPAAGAAARLLSRRSTRST